MLKVHKQMQAIINGRVFVAQVGETDDSAECIASIYFGKVQAEGRGPTPHHAINDLQFKCKDLDTQYGGRVP